jgi:hypothetical protein
LISAKAQWLEPQPSKAGFVHWFHFDVVSDVGLGFRVDEESMKNCRLSIITVLVDDVVVTLNADVLAGRQSRFNEIGRVKLPAIPGSAALSTQPAELALRGCREATA